MSIDRKCQILLLKIIHVEHVAHTVNLFLDTIHNFVEKIIDVIIAIKR